MDNAMLTMLAKLREKKNFLHARMMDDEPQELETWNRLRRFAHYRKCSGCRLGELSPDMECYENYCLAYNDELSAYPEMEVPDKDLQACRDFAGKSDYSKAAERGSSSYEKMVEDNVAGKIGEYIVANTLRALKVTCGYPDMKLYEASSKSFSPDLKAVIGGEAAGISVKTFRIRYGKPARVSWVMQKSDINGKGGKDKHFFDADDSCRKNQWFAAVALSPDMKHGRILAFMPMQLLYDAKIYKQLEIKNGKYETTKRAVYWDDLLDKGLLPYMTGIPFIQRHD